MGDAIIYIVIIAGILLFIIKGKGLYAARARNTIISWATGDEGYCCYCKHCKKDTSRRYSNTDWYCELYKCEDITPETYMHCFEKPKITEQDLQELFELGIWNEAGKEYIRKSILGRAMTFPELDEFMTKIPSEHPEYIDPNCDIDNLS